MRNNNAGCLTVFVSSFSRILLLFYWIARPVMMNSVFNTFIFPCLGFLFLPFTTLMYVLLITSNPAQPGLQGWDWLWIFLAIILDVASVGASGYTNRDKIPAGYPGAYDVAAPEPATPMPPPPDKPVS